MPLPRPYTYRNQTALDHVSEAWSIVERDNIAAPDRAKAIAHLKSAIESLTGGTVAPPEVTPAPDTTRAEPKGEEQKATRKNKPRMVIPDELPTFARALLKKFAAAEASMTKRRRLVVEHDGVTYYRCSRDGHWAAEAWFVKHSNGGPHSWCLRCMRTYTRESAAKVREKLDVAKAEEAA